MASAVSEALRSALQVFDPPPSGDVLWYKAHGFLMWLAFSIIFPVGILGVRYNSITYKKLSSWFQYHWVLQVIGVLLSTIGLSIALRRFESRDSVHGKMGLILAFIVLIQPIFAIFRPSIGGHWRPCWAFSHWFLGTVAVILGWVNIFQGLDLYFVDWPGTGPQTLFVWVFSAQVSIVVFFYLVMVRCPDSDGDYDHVKLSQPLLEREQFLINV